MRALNYHNKHFKTVSNTENGEVGAETHFHYRQKGEVIVWATYEGGGILFGTLSGCIRDTGELEFQYQHQNLLGEFMTGQCVSKPEVLKDGRIKLHEKWQWTCKDRSTGESVIEEFKK